MIARYDAVENYVFRATDVIGWIVTWGSSHKLYVFTVFLTDARLNDLIPYNIMGQQILKKCACGNKLFC